MKERSVRSVLFIFLGFSLLLVSFSASYVSGYSALANKEYYDYCLGPDPCRIGTNYWVTSIVSGPNSAEPGESISISARYSMFGVDYSPSSADVKSAYGCPQTDLSCSASNLIATYGSNGVIFDEVRLNSESGGISGGTRNITIPPTAVPGSPVYWGFWVQDVTPPTGYGSPTYSYAQLRIDVVAPVCGNGVVEGTEECDDGNAASGDGCSSTCTIETPIGCCDDDDSDLWMGDTPVDTFLGTCTNLLNSGREKLCSDFSFSGSENDTCDNDASRNPGVAEICNDGIDNNCDGVIDEGCALGGCVSDADCSGYDPYCTGSGCACPYTNNGQLPGPQVSPMPPAKVEICNDGVDNDCDGKIDAADPDCGNTCTSTCPSLGFECGSQTVCGSIVNCGSCSSGSSCVSGSCVADVAKSYCGDGKIDVGEECDGINLAGKTCTDFAGYAGGNLKCYSSGSMNSCTFDTTQCNPIVTSNLYWTDMMGNPIVIANLGDTVRMVAEDVSSGTFDIKEDDLLLNPDDNIKLGVSGSQEGSNWVGNWTIEEADLVNTNDYGEFYFLAGGDKSVFLEVNMTRDDNPLIISIEGINCADYFDEGITKNINITAIDVDSVIAGNVLIDGSEVATFTNGGVSFDYTFDTIGSVQVLVEGSSVGGSDRVRIIDNVMVLDTKPSGGYEDGSYVAACINKPKDLSNIPGRIVDFDASSTRGVRVAGGVLDVLVPGEDEFSWFWKFYPDSLLNRNFINSKDPSAFQFTVEFAVSGVNTAELLVEVA